MDYLKCVDNQFLSLGEEEEEEEESECSGNSVRPSEPKDSAGHLPTQKFKQLTRNGK